jgi:hypothetical protein
VAEPLVTGAFPSLKKPPSIIEMSTNGILDFQGTNKATFVGENSNVVIDTVNASFGIGVDVNGPTSNLHVVGNAYVTSNLEVGTANLFVDTVSGRVGIGKTDPGATLDVVGDAAISSNLAVGTNKLFVDTVNSRVGVGTVSPVAKLNIQGTSEGAPPTSGGEGTSNGIFRLRDNFNVALDIGTLGASPWSTWLQVADTTAMDTEYPLSLNPNGGNVGVGTDSPGAKLDVRGEVRGNYNTDTTSYFGRSAIGYVGHSDWAGFAHLDRNNTSDYALLQNSSGRTILNCKSTEKISFSSGDNAQMTMLGTGNFGIGTATPRTNLHIGQQLNSQGDKNTIPAAGLGISANFPSSTHAWFAHRTNSTGDEYWGLAVGTIYSGSSYLQNLNKNTATYYDLLLQPNGGNVGIGTTDPGYRLEVGLNTSTASHLNVIAIQPHIMWESATAHWQMWNNGTDSHLRFWCSGDKAYLQCAGVNDLLNFTGQHRTFIKNVPFSQAGDLEGLIVSSDQNKYIKMSGGIECGTNAITVNESLPVVSVSNVFQDKRCFGVISTSEDPDTRQDKHGNLVSIFDKEGGDTRVYINSVGEGAIWVTNINGSLESGDYVTTSNVAGYGQKQDSEFLANYTVAKITMDCDFEPVTQPIQIIKKEMGDVNYWVKTTYKNVSEEEYSNLTEENRRIVDDIYQRVIKEDTKTEKEGYELEVRQELVNVLDEHGQIQWEDHPTETEKAYKIRYLDADGNITDEANAVHKAAFVGCTYHCG